MYIYLWVGSVYVMLILLFNVFKKKNWKTYCAVRIAACRSLPSNTGPWKINLHASRYSFTMYLLCVFNLNGNVCIIILHVCGHFINHRTAMLWYQSIGIFKKYIWRFEICAYIALDRKSVLNLFIGSGQGAIQPIDYNWMRKNEGCFIEKFVVIYWINTIKFNFFDI